MVCRTHKRPYHRLCHCVTVPGLVLAQWINKLPGANCPTGICVSSSSSTQHANTHTHICWHALQHHIHLTRCWHLFYSHISEMDWELMDTDRYTKSNGDVYKPLFFPSNSTALLASQSSRILHATASIMQKWISVDVSIIAECVVGFQPQGGNWIELVLMKMNPHWKCIWLMILICRNERQSLLDYYQSSWFVAVNTMSTISTLIKWIADLICNTIFCM